MVLQLISIFRFDKMKQVFVLLLFIKWFEVLESVWILCEDDQMSSTCDVKSLESLYGFEAAFRQGNYSYYDYPFTPATRLPVTRTKRTRMTVKRNDTTLAMNSTTTVPTTSTTITTTTQKPLPIPVRKELLLIRHCNITYMPLSLGKCFPNLRTIVVWSSGLKELDTVNFEDMPYMKDLNFEDNIIEQLDENTFFKLDGLASLNLARNFIKVLPEKLLSSSKQLQSFIANNNQIEFLPASLFAANPKMSFVNFNCNKIKVIAIDFTKTKLKKVLGLNNICADFFLNKVVDAKKLNALVKANCSQPMKPT